MTPLSDWESFYVIVGSSAGGLTGLQFVVMTLIAQSPTRNRGESVSAFGTPNVVHFCAALLVSAILSIPWSALHHAGVAIVLCGLLGVGYSLIVLGRARRQRGYKPVFEDWLWHNVLPLVAYTAMVVAGVALLSDSAGVLFVVGFATLLLIFIGVHNAWDTVTYLMVIQGSGAPATAPPPPAPSPKKEPDAKAG